MAIKANATMVKFGYPQTSVADYEYWSVLVRPQQPTLGSLVLVNREMVASFAESSEQAFKELKQVASDATKVLSALFNPDKFNYLMLMMVDPDVHFHLLPRYSSKRSFGRIEYKDAFWPKPIDLLVPSPVDEDILLSLTHTIKERWS